MEPYRSLWHALFASMPGVCEFDQDPLFRLADGNYTALRRGLLLFRDDHHLSSLGSDLVAAALRTSGCM